MKTFIQDELKKTRDVMDILAQDDAFHEILTTIVDAATHSLKAGGTLFFAGNGGSAADAQHLAAELVGRIGKNRPAIRAIALTTDTSALTAIANDFGYDTVFSRQLEALATEKDLFFASSTSGNSSNIIKALDTAKTIGMTTVGMTGREGNQMAALCDYLICIPSNETPHIQEGHITIGHIICTLIEQALFA